MTQLAAITGAFALGVLLRSLFHFGWPVYVFVLLLIVICAAAAFLKSRLAYSLGAVFFALLLCGMLRAALADTAPPKIFAAQLKHHVSYTGVVASDPDLRDKNQLVTVAVTESGTATKLLAMAPRYPTVALGERITVIGTLTLPMPFADDNGRVFRYDKYLQKDGIRFVIENASLKEIAPAPWYSLAAQLARVKHAFLHGIDAVLPEPQASLAAGLAIGGKSGLGPDLEAAFIASGLVQIVVLSGYNVMIVAEGVMSLLRLCKLSSRTSALIGAFAIIAFVLIAGASSTALRALLMALIALYARVTSRSYAAGRALLVVVFLMLLWHPLLLAFDPGFDLSVAATAGLIWLSPIIEVKLGRIPNEFWREGIATTLAAQIAVLPLLLYETGNLSLVAIPANLLTLPVVPIAMALSAIAGFTGMVFGSIAFPIAYPAYLATSYIVWIAQNAAQLPGAAFTIPAFPFPLVVAAYAALAYIAFAKRSSITLQLRLSKKASI